ncbi:MAG TPA: SDR family NAD(P)-dependent oxidoreductase [Saprospiraceae bacterium]|nr:SDR family NAD(P)-dependent oxidoreductase [Saprospiraceae bacterium]
MNGKPIALVTGAAKGIGLAIAERLAADGFFVIAADLDADAGELSVGKKDAASFSFVALDVSDESRVKQLFASIEQRYHRLDVLVNNAGIIRDNLITNMPSDDFDRVLQVNLKGPWLLCREAARMMTQQRSGRIINISSRAWLGNAGQSNYSASKAGVVSLTRVLALELGRYNVLVNAIAPGLIDTELTRNLKPEVLQKLIDAQPGKNMGRAEDIAHLASFLASGETNFITGQVIYVDGGRSIGSAI